MQAHSPIKRNHTYDKCHTVPDTDVSESIYSIAQKREECKRNPKDRREKKCWRMATNRTKCRKKNGASFPRGVEKSCGKAEKWGGNRSKGKKQRGFPNQLSTSCGESEGKKRRYFVSLGRKPHILGGYIGGIHSFPQNPQPSQRSYRTQRGFSTRGDRRE